MAGLTLQTDAFILRKRPPAEKFTTLTGFSPTDGLLTLLERISPRKSSPAGALDLFDEASLLLESSNQGQTWFIRESRLLARQEAIGRDYEVLRHASAFAGAVARNPVPDQSRANIGELLRNAFRAFALSRRPDIVGLKSLYRFARDEGHPVSQQWLPELAVGDRKLAESLLSAPVASLDTPPDSVERIQHSLQNYLRGNTEMILE